MADRANRSMRHLSSQREAELLKIASLLSRQHMLISATFILGYKDELLDHGKEVKLRLFLSRIFTVAFHAYIGQAGFRCKGCRVPCRVKPSQGGEKQEKSYFENMSNRNFDPNFLFRLLNNVEYQLCCCSIFVNVCLSDLLIW